jgi:voltage-gated potassium channel
VAEFLDVVMHDDTLEYRIEEFDIGEDSSLRGATLSEAAIRKTTGALVLALRQPAGLFLANPPPETTIEAHAVLIALGTPDQLDGVRREVGSPQAPLSGQL